MTEKKAKGFAALTPEQRREISSRGGKAAHSGGKAHQWTKEEASKAGKKGGRKTSKDTKHMASIGKKGGKKAHSKGKAHQWTKEEASQAGKKGARSRRKGKKDEGQKG